MPVDIDELVRIGSGKAAKPVEQKPVSKSEQKSNIQTVDDLANIGSGKEIKKKVGSEENTTTTSSDQSTIRLTDEAQQGIGIALGDNTQQPKSKVGATQVQFANLPKPKTAQEQLADDAKRFVARKEATKKSIDIYNQTYGTKFNADEVTNDPEKAAEFFNLYKERYNKALHPDIRVGGAPSISQIAKPKGIDEALLSYDAPPSEKMIARNELISKGEQNLDLLKNKVVDLTIDEARLKGIPKNQLINNLHKRLDPKGYENRLKAIDERTTVGLSDIVSGGPFLKDNSKDIELLNTEKAPYEFAINESLKRQANDMITAGTLHGNNSLVEGGKSLMAQVRPDDDIYASYPSLNKSRVAEGISKELAAKAGQLKGTEAEGLDAFNKVRGYTGSVNLEAFTTDAFKKFYNNPKTREAALEVAANPNEYLSDASYFGGVEKNIAKPFKELGLSLLDITGVRDKMDRLADTKNEELFPEVTPELKGYVSKIKGAINTTAYLTGMMAIQIPSTSVATAVGLGTKAATRVGTAMSFGIPSFDANLKDADNFLENDGAKAAYATVSAMINTVGGEFLELGKISKFKDLQSPILELAEKITDKNITEKAVGEILAKAKDPYVNALVKYGTNVTKGAAVMSYFTFANGVNKMLFGGEGTSKELVENTGTAFVDGLLGMSVLGGFGAHADLQKEKNTSYKSTIKNLGDNADATRDLFDIAYKNGDYTRPEYNEKVQILNTIIAAKSNLDIAEAGSTNTLDAGQRSVYVANRTAEGVIKKQLESPLLNEKQKADYQSQLKRLQTQREDILQGLTFSDNLEPLNEIFEAQKEYRKAYEDFNEGVVENDSEVLKAKQKLETAMADYSNKNKPKDETVNQKTSAETGTEKSSTKESGSEEKTIEESTDTGTTGTDRNTTETSTEPVNTESREGGIGTSEGIDKRETELTEPEQKAIEGFKGVEFKGSTKNWTDVIQSETATPQEKKQALTELKEQLSDPNSEIATGEALGKSSDLIYDLIDADKKASTEAEPIPPSTVKSEEEVYRVGEIKDGATWVAKTEDYINAQRSPSEPETGNKKYIADLGNVFDIRNKEHFDSLKAALITEHGEQKGLDIFDDAVSGHKTYEDFINAIKENKNLFDDFADIGIQGIPDEVFKEMGYDSYLNREGGEETYKIFDSKRVKSENKPIQNEGTEKEISSSIKTETNGKSNGKEGNSENTDNQKESNGSGKGEEENVKNEGAVEESAAPFKELFEGDNAEKNKKEFDKLTSDIPNGGEIKKYLSGDTIKKYEEGTELRNNQEIVSQELEPALRHGVEVIEKAKEIFGEDYVGKTLDYIERENLNPENKALLYVSLENEMAKQIAINPESLDLKKKQDLVRTKSQAYLRSNSLAINMGRLRKFAEAGYDITLVTDKFFSSKEREQKAEVEKLVQADAETIQKQAEENYKLNNLTDAEIEAKIKEGVESEISKIYEALPKEKKTAADKAIAALDKVQQKLRNKTYSDVTGITAFIDAGITTMKAAIKAGVKIAEAVEMGIAKIKEKYGKEWAKEDEFRKDVLDGLKSEGAIEKERQKQAAKEYRVLETERNRQLKKVGELKDKLARFEKGEPTEKDIREQLKDVPEIEDLKQQVKVAETAYNKKVAEEKRAEINVEKLEAELERVKDRKSKEPKENKAAIKELTDKENELISEIKTENEKWQSEKDNTKKAEKEYKALETQRNRQLERVANLNEKLDKLNRGERPETKSATPKIDVPEIENLKKSVKDATKTLNEFDAQQERIKGLETELDRLQNRLPKDVKESMKREVSEKEAELKSQIEAEKEAIRKDEKFAKLFTGVDGEEKTRSQRLSDAKTKIENDIEVVREEIIRKQKVVSHPKDKLQDDQELTRLREQKKTLERLRDTYLGQDTERYKEEKALDRVKDKLTKEILDINTQINNEEKSYKDKKTASTNPEIEALKKEKESRQSILEALDPTPKQYVENALIEQGFGKTINIKTKNGVEERKVLDWKKLAGEEGSVTKISEAVGKSLEKSGFTPEQLERISDAFIKEYTDLRASVIEKGLNEIAARNKTTVTPDQKSAAKKLSEMYNYGLFDKNLEEYETVLAKTIGVNKLNNENLSEALVLGKAISKLLSSDFQGKRLTESQMRSAIQVIEDKMRYILHNEANEHGSTALKIADTARTYMDLVQRMTLNSLKQAAENPMSGKLESLFSDIGYSGSIPNVLNKSARKQARQIYKEMVLEKGVNYGDVSSTFVNKGNLEMQLDKMSDNKLLQGVMSTVIGRTTLDAVDSMYKAKLTQQKFTYNLIQVLQKDRLIDGAVHKGMSKENAKKYVAEKLTGQSFKEAQETAKEIIDSVNKDAGKKIFNDSPLFVDRLANDIVTAALVNGQKISAEQVKSSYNAAYKAAGRGLGHVANNFISKGIGNVSGKLESDINTAVREKEYKKAAMLTYASIFFRNIANPFVGGGTNWIVLKAEKTGLGLVSGLGSMMANGRKMDLTSEAGMKNLENAMYQNLKVKDKMLRGAVGGAATVVAAIVMAGVTNMDEYRKWRNKNKWAAKYLDIVTPEIILAAMAKQSKELLYYFKTTANKNDAFDKGTMAIKAATGVIMGDVVEKVEDKAGPSLGKLTGSMFGAPTPWRLIRDGQQIWQGVTGGEPYRVDNTKPETFWQAYFKGGMIDYLGHAPKP